MTAACFSAQSSGEAIPGFVGERTEQRERALLRLAGPRNARTACRGTSARTGRACGRSPASPLRSAVASAPASPANARGVSRKMFRVNWSSRRTRASAPCGVAHQSSNAPAIAAVDPRPKRSRIRSSNASSLRNQLARRRAAPGRTRSRALRVRQRRSGGACPLPPYNSKAGSTQAASGPARRPVVTASPEPVPLPQHPAARLLPGAAAHQRAPG